MASQEELYGSLDLDRHVQNFKNCLRVLLSDERLLHGGKSIETEVIDKCSVALNQMVELHYDKRHLKDVLRRGREEIDFLKNKVRDSNTLVNHLTNVQGVHEERIEDLTTRLRKEKQSNVDKEAKIVNMNKNIENIKDQTKRAETSYKDKVKWIETDQMRIYKDGRATLERLDNEKIALKNEFEDAKNSTAGLKAALENARTKLSDAIDESNIDPEA
ncbi:Oidioi.mRNA.OKI2018_I69.chr2.g5137.t1.cds [Oikopleura dioica]|uniref:Oidioi.mRNA.OKI2018_I69.chr2.g5137.t1.cds n=1 Tax=Oikopleura dioica TaxID=34765 RepID=A0ABN7T626_OIKDI|nr:Oidioi.mRNA.OKI2018_I69.chr2.g5137.t1.cds [Oikopleura dioica]